ncbi:hypothetical protein LINPERHAP1_LOCUS35389 [Linum perenne]
MQKMINGRLRSFPSAFLSVLQLLCLPPARYQSARAVSGHGAQRSSTAAESNHRIRRKHSSISAFNGLEILKGSNDVKRLDGVASVDSLIPSKAKKIGIVIGSSVGAVAAIALIGLCCCSQQGHLWLPLPFRVYKGTLEDGKRGNPRQKKGMLDQIMVGKVNPASLKLRSALLSMGFTGHQWEARGDLICANGTSR